QLAVGDKQHADREPLLLPVAQGAGELAALAGETDLRQGRIDAVALFARQPREQGAPSATDFGERQFEIIEYGQVLEHGGALEFTADAEIGDVRLVETGQIL